MPRNELPGCRDNISILGKMLFVAIVDSIFIAAWLLGVHLVDEIIKNVRLGPIDQFSLEGFKYVFAASTGAFVFALTIRDLSEALLGIWRSLLDLILSIYRLYVDFVLELRRERERFQQDGSIRRSTPTEDPPMASSEQTEEESKR